jgi:prefoldin subunit 5
MEENVQNTVSDSIGAGITGQPSGKSSKTQQLWVKRIKYEQKCHKDFRDRSREVEKVYRKQDLEDLYVPLFWQVVSIEHTGVYSNQPVPDVRPRNEPQNPVMRKVAKTIQRGLAYCVDQQGFDDTMHRAVDDYLALGLGIPRVKIDSIIEQQTTENPIMDQVVQGYDPQGMPIIGEQQVGVESLTEDVVGDQYLRWEFVPWDCFGYQPGNSWKHTDWVYFKHPMTQKEIIERWKRPVAATKEQKDGNVDNWKAKTYDIYEVWCKKKKQVLFIAEGESEPLEVIDDPLELKNFFPIPQPMMMNLPSDRLVPQSDYDYIESYDVEINRLQERRMGLLEQIRASGAYDEGLPELGDMFENEDGEYTPVPNLMQRLEAVGGIDNALTHLPIQEKAVVLQQLTEQIQFVRAQVDEVLGISDIVRGVTAASETATAQEIKGRWVGIRLTRKRECVQYTVREMMRIMAQLLGSHITPENLSRMTQMPLTDQELQILQDDVLMEFSIDIETDSTVAKDEQREMQTKQEMLNGVAQYSQSVLPMVQQNMMPSGVASAILRSALAPYTKYDRNLEEELATLPQTMGQLQQLNQQLQQAQQQLQQSQQQAQQWQMAAQQLQERATEATAAQKQADAMKKQAETAEIQAGLPDAEIQQGKTFAEMDLIRAQTGESRARTVDLLRPEPPRQNGIG